ncbi:class II Aldolase and Adducin domain-containing protein [Colletotrichum truncatum]|uniref:Class II Aldolase and Adducin domain-containing protein n=1 Tax=Colletotrichum truncatum TaxID=5467 RepID=A0ACC3YEK7_COLTU
MGERTGSRVFQWVWSYVTVLACNLLILMSCT